MPGNFHDVPKAVLAQWPKHHYVHPRVKRDWLPILSCTLLGFSTVLVLGRLFLRARKVAGVLGIDDIFITIAWIVSVGFSTVAVLDSNWYGLNVHTWDVPPDEYAGAALMGFIAQILFLCSTCATKASVLLFYRRMAKDTYTKTWLYATWAALAFTAGYFIGVLLAYCLMCQPLSAYWLSYNFGYDKPYTCLNGNVLSPLVGVLSVVSDLYAVLLPCIWLHRYNLHITLRQRIGLDVVFALGTLVAGCGIARTYYLWELNHTYDTSWVAFDLFVWSLLECHLAIIFACAPSLRAFVRRYLADMFGSSFRSSNKNSPRGSDKVSEKTPTVESDEGSEDPELGQSQAGVQQTALASPSRDEVDAQSDDLWARSEVSDEESHIDNGPVTHSSAFQQLNPYQQQHVSARGNNASSPSVLANDQVQYQKQWRS